MFWSSVVFYHATVVVFLYQISPLTSEKPDESSALLIDRNKSRFEVATIASNNWTIFAPLLCNAENSEVSSGGRAFVQRGGKV